MISVIQSKYDWSKNHVLINIGISRKKRWIWGTLKCGTITITKVKKTGFWFRSLNGIWYCRGNSWTSRSRRKSQKRLVGIKSNTNKFWTTVRSIEWYTYIYVKVYVRMTANAHHIPAVFINVGILINIIQIRTFTGVCWRAQQVFDEN